MRLIGSRLLRRKCSGEWLCLSGDIELRILTVTQTRRYACVLQGHNATDNESRPWTGRYLHSVRVLERQDRKEFLELCGWKI